MELRQQIAEATSFLNSKNISTPEIGIVLGTGLGKLADEIQNQIVIDYATIPHFPVSTVESHKGKLIFGTISGKKVLAMQGRFHYYEGYSMQQVTFPIRVMQALGIETLLLSGAAGGLNLSFKKGELMMIKDHINLLPDNPLMGPNDNELGPRFPDMSEAYDKAIQAKVKAIALETAITLREGVYVSVMGPMLESPAEYRFLHRIGADAVGMSTVPEVIVAKHAGMKCAAVIVITDECDPDNLQAVNIAEIIQIAGTAELKLIELFKGLIAEL
jgi:purine-nucleoside phosphorylase